MPRRQQGKPQHFTMQGKPIDFDALRAKNEKTIAVGNAGTNARGDQIGAGGKIVKKRDEK